MKHIIDTQLDNYRNYYQNFAFLINYPIVFDNQLEKNFHKKTAKQTNFSEANSYASRVILFIFNFFVSYIKMLLGQKKLYATGSLFKDTYLLHDYSGRF